MKPNNKNNIGITLIASLGSIAVLMGVCYLMLHQRIKRYFQNSYRMQSNPRGFCLIINNTCFATSSLPTRYGALKDEFKLKEIFEKILFEVIVVRNATTSKIRETIEEIRKNRKLESHDAFVCVLMSHGGLGDHIFGTDGTSISVNEVTKSFNDENCIELRGKPKLFFVNACRGGK